VSDRDFKNPVFAASGRVKKATNLFLNLFLYNLFSKLNKKI